MATTGSVTSKRFGGGSYGPRLRMDWRVTSQSNSGNYSLVSVNLYVIISHAYVSYSAKKYGKIDGTSFSRHINVNKVGTYWLGEKTGIKISHNNTTGAASKSISAYYDIDITWSNVWTGRMSVSATITPNVIPRATTIGSFKMDSSLKQGQSNRIYFKASVKQSAHRHKVQVRYENESSNLDTWSSTNLGSTDSSGYTYVTLTADVVDVIMRKSSKGYNPTLKVYVDTRSSHNSGTFVGATQSATITSRISSTVVPSVWGVTAGLVSGGHDHYLDKFVQNISRVFVNGSYSGGYGATIANKTVYVRKTDGSDSQSIAGQHTGTTARAVRSNGKYEAVISIRDSRGKTTTDNYLFTVAAYSAPKISKFEVKRDELETNVARIDVGTTWTSFSGTNSISVKVTKELDGRVIATPLNVTGSDYNGSYTKSVISRNTEVDISYDFALTLKDQFGSVVTSAGTVATQRVVLDIHKNEGIGIGKYHEAGALDVDGDVRFRNSSGGETVRLISNSSTGHGYMTWFNSLDERVAYIGIPNATSNHLNIYNEQAGNIVMKGEQLRFNNDEVIGKGSNNRGAWIRFYDGTQICWNSSFNVKNRDLGSRAYLYEDWVYPNAFKVDSNTRVAGFGTKNWYSQPYKGVATVEFDHRTGTSGRFFISYGSDRTSSDKENADIYVMVIGSWK